MRPTIKSVSIQARATYIWSMLMVARLLRYIAHQKRKSLWPSSFVTHLRSFIRGSCKSKIEIIVSGPVVANALSEGRKDCSPRRGDLMAGRRGVLG
jgi:hypothetical protein